MFKHLLFGALLNAPPAYQFLKISPRTFLGPPLLIFANFDLINCRISKNILSIKSI